MRLTHDERTKRFVALLICLVVSALAALIVMSCSSDGLQRTLASTYVEGGQFDTADGEPNYVAAGFKPLAALEPPTEVRWADDLPPNMAAPPDNTHLTDDWWENEKFLIWIERLLTVLVGAAVAIFGKRAYDQHQTKKKAEHDAASV